LYTRHSPSCFSQCYTMSVNFFPPSHPNFDILPFYMNTCHKFLIHVFLSPLLLWSQLPLKMKATTAQDWENKSL
jgi:hypothetical protein